MVTFDLARRDALPADAFPRSSKIGEFHARYVEALQVEQEIDSVVKKLRAQLGAAQQQLQTPSEGVTAQDLAHLPAQIVMLEAEIERQQEQLSAAQKHRKNAEQGRTIALYDYRSAITAWNIQSDPERADNSLSPARWLRTLRQLDSLIEQFEQRSCTNGRPSGA